MMKTSVLRQARFGRAALSAVSRVQTVSRPSLSPLVLSSIPRALAAPCRSAASPLLRLYSSAADAPAQHRQPELVTKFRDLQSLGVAPEIVHSITEGMKYEDMTPVQSKTINAALAGRDLVAQAKTGTGKTLAFLVPVIQRILADQPELAQAFRYGARSDDIRAIVISPTRELAEQIAQEAKRLTRKTSIKVQCAVGGTAKASMLRTTQREGCHLLVATPGRLLDLLQDPYSRIAAPQLQTLVLDEADRMLEVGFDEDLKNILGFLPNRADVPRQTLLFSATIPKNVVSLARTYIDERNFEFVQTVDPNEVQTHENVPQHIVPCKGFENLLPTLVELIEREVTKAQTDPDAMPFKAIVFCQTTASVVLMKSLFRRLAYQDPSMPKILDIHSKLTQRMRTESATQFRNAKSAILFSSDVTARGLDFPNVSHVIQVHLPKDREHYIHRVGRTGRAGKGGQAWILVSDMEVPLARNQLHGLPIQRSTELVCSSVDATAVGAQLPHQFTQVSSVMSRIPQLVMDDMYRSLLGGALTGNDKRHLVENLNNMARVNFGYDQPPAVPAALARAFGPHSGLNVIVHKHRGHSLGGGRIAGRLPEGSGSDSGSPFDRMMRSAAGNRDGNRGGRGGGRGGGFGTRSRAHQASF